ASEAGSLAENCREWSARAAAVKQALYRRTGTHQRQSRKQTIATAKQTQKRRLEMLEEQAREASKDKTRHGRTERVVVDRIGVETGHFDCCDSAREIENR